MLFFGSIEYFQGDICIAVGNIVFFFRSGRLRAKLALELSTYLHNEKEYVPWYVGLVNLAYIGSLLEEQDTYTYYTVSMLPVNVLRDQVVHKQTPEMTSVT